MIVWGRFGPSVFGDKLSKVDTLGRKYNMSRGIRFKDLLFIFLLPSISIKGVLKKTFFPPDFIQTTSLFHTKGKVELRDPPSSPPMDGLGLHCQCLMPALIKPEAKWQPATPEPAF